MTGYKSAEEIVPSKGGLSGDERMVFRCKRREIRTALCEDTIDSFEKNGFEVWVGGGGIEFFTKIGEEFEFQGKATYVRAHEKVMMAVEVTHGAEGVFKGIATVEKSACRQEPVNPFDKKS